MRRHQHPPAPEPPAHANPLAVAWENQNDNASGTGYRECFSSSCAIRAKYGDSTSAEAQLSALRSLGLSATFATNGDRAALEQQINLGRPHQLGVVGVW